MDRTLEPYSRRFAETLFRRFPEWKGRESVDPESRAMSLSIEAPAEEGVNLWISTDEEEITVGLGSFWHTHIGGTGPERDPVREREGFDDAIDLVANLLAEELVLAEAYIGERLVTASVIRPAQMPHFQRLEGLTRIRFFSWKGSHTATKALGC